MDSATWTIEAWARPDAIGGNDRYYVIDDRDQENAAGRHLAMIHDRRWVCGINDGQGHVLSAWRAGARPLGEWYHVACALSETHLTIYVNGEVDARTPLDGFQYAPSDDEVYIGRRFSGHTGDWTGAIDGVRITSRALAPEELLHGPPTTWSLGPVTAQGLTDDFDDGDYTGGWQVINGQWEETDGRLYARSGCQHYDICPQGRSLIRTIATVPVNEGHLRIAYDFLLNSTQAGHTSSRVILQGDDGIGIGPAGSLAGVRGMCGGYQNTVGGQFAIYAGGVFHETVPGVAQDVGYHAEVICRGDQGTEYSLTRLDNGEEVARGTHADWDCTPPADVEAVFVAISSMNSGQWFDNLEVELLP